MKRTVLTLVAILTIATAGASLGHNGGSGTGAAVPSTHPSPRPGSGNGATVPSSHPIPRITPPPTDTEG
jgi:hypothetical protein